MTEDPTVREVRLLTALPHARAGYTVAEVCEMLSVSRPTVYKLIHAGDLDSFTIGRARRIVPASLDRFIKARLELDALEAAEAEVERHERAETLARVLYCHLNGYPIGTSWAGIGMARRGQYRDAARAALDVLELR